MKDEQMSNQEVASQHVSAPSRGWRSLAIGGAITALILTVIARGDLGAVARYLGGFAAAFAHPHAPDLAPIVAAGPLVMIHAGAAIAALVVGTILMLGVKGRLMHRTLGWIWVGFMMAVAFASIFIRVVNPGGFSVIHILSAYVLIAAPLGLVYARRHMVVPHGRMMTGLYFGALWVAGTFTFLPGRIMHGVFFG
jgi:uncharacterized membrane protein